MENQIKETLINVDNLIELGLLAYLWTMEEYVENEEYEKAAHLRDAVAYFQPYLKFKVPDDFGRTQRKKASSLGNGVLQKLFDNKTKLKTMIDDMYCCI
jgi:hypothetical protein